MKNFEDNLKVQFTGLKVKLPQVAKNLDHLFADYIELIALFSNQAYVTRDDILYRVQEEGESTLNEVIKNEVTDEEDEDDIFEDSSTAKRNDIKERWCDKLFQVLDDRSRIFNTSYPFLYSTQSGLILKEQVDNAQELYIFLLIASNLDLFNKVASYLTTDFEEVSFFVLKNYLQSAQVRRFGKNSQYQGSAITKIKALAKDMKLEINENSLANVSDQNMQERGLDVIAWIPFTDNCPNIITILGQCACGKDWSKKYHDTQRFSNYMKYFRQKPNHAMFIPYSLISRNSDWFYRSDDIERGSLMFERKRIIDLFNNDMEFDQLLSRQIIKKCIKYSEDIV
jgi:hypothetical protein